MSGAACRCLVDVAAADEHLPGWDYADAWEISTGGSGRPPPALDAARSLLDVSGPGRAVLRLRDTLARLASLRPALSGSEDLFPVLHADEGLAVLGMDDRHLDFRIVVDVDPVRVRCTTLVRRHGALGRAYFALVQPFHVRVVPRLLQQGAHRQWRAGGPARRPDPSADDAVLPAESRP